MTLAAGQENFALLPGSICAVLLFCRESSRACRTAETCKLIKVGQWLTVEAFEHLAEHFLILGFVIFVVNNVCFRNLISKVKKFSNINRKTF